MAKESIKARERKRVKLVEKYAKKRGMINASQAVEKILEEIK